MFQIFIVLFAEPRFQQHLTKENLENCEQLSIEFSICIWLASANLVWQSVKLNSPLTNTPESSIPLQILKAKIKNNLKNSPTPSKSPVGFINKGNTYSANTILQALSVIPLHWAPSSAESAQLSPLLKSFALNMAIKKISCAN